MKLLVVRMWAVVLAILFVATAAAASVSQNRITTDSEPQVEPKGTSSRTVLLEMFTGTWCGWCGVIKPGISRLLDEFGPDRLLMLAYHNSDAFTDPILDPARRAFYQQTFYGFPTTVIDGGGYTTGLSLFVVGSQGTSPADYDFYKAKTNSELTKLTNIQLTLTGDLTPTSASITAEVYASDQVSETNVTMRFALYEDALYATQTNGPPIHKYVVRELVQIPMMISMGETQFISHTFTPNPLWDKNRMGVVAFVQDDARRAYGCYPTVGDPGRQCFNSPVMQAAKYHYVPANTLYARDDEVTDMTVSPLRGEYMEAPLSDADRPFDVWNTFDTMLDTGTNDVRGTPDLATMQEYGAVIWSTGSATMILDPINVADLSGYLNGYGNLWIHGENVANDLILGQPAFLASYLHSTHGTDPGPPAPTYTNGVAGDPITGAWTATNLAFAGTSPDNVDPGAGGITMLNYPGLNSAAVRADHDLDSRVVTMGQNYFQGADPIARRTSMVNNALDWFDGVAGPKVTLVTPNGGEQYSPGEMVAIRWTAVDVEIPIDGVDIYFTDTLSSPVWSPVTASEPNDGVYTWTIPNLQTADCGIKVVVRDGDMMTSEGEAISAAPCLIGSPDVSITKQVSNPTPQVGEQITYTITLTNAGPVTGYATVTDALPVGVTYVSDDGGLTGISAYFPGNRTCVWTVAVPGLSNVIWNIVVSVDPGPPGTLISNYAFYNSSNSAGGSSQSGNDNAGFQIPSLDSWFINLAPGKRFMSIPLLLADYRVDVVLQSIAGRYSYVRQYDAWDAAHPWKSYVPGRAINTLTHLTIGTGFWIEITSPANLSLDGARPVTTNIQLNAGWNMVGYPSYSTTYTIGMMKAALGLPNVRAEGFDAASPSYNLWRLPDSYVMTTGEGYWIFVPSATTWTVTF